MHAGPARGNSMIRFVLSTTGALLFATSLYAQEPPPLRTALDGTFAPHAFPNLSGGYQGFNVDLANEIGKRLKRKIVLDAAQFSGLVPAAPLRKDSGELRKTLDVAIECMKLDGTIAKMHERWFGVAPAADSAAVTVFPGYGVPDMPGYDPTAHTPSCS